MSTKISYLTPKKPIDFERYRYFALVNRMIDGDTIEVDLLLGLDVKIRQTLRLARIDAWEVKGNEKELGITAREALTELFIDNIDNEIIIETIKDKKGKYGRYLAEVWMKMPDGDLLNINDWVVENGHGEYRDY